MSSIFSVGTCSNLAASLVVNNGTSVAVSVTHSGHSLRYVRGVSSHRRLDTRLRGHLEHERQKCQMSAVGSPRYSMIA